MMELAVLALVLAAEDSLSIRRLLMLVESALPDRVRMVVPVPHTTELPAAAVAHQKLVMNQQKTTSVRLVVMAENATSRVPL